MCRPMEEWGALTLRDVDLWKFSVLIDMVVGFCGLLAFLAVGRWHSSVRKAINGDVVNGKIRNRKSVKEKARH